MREMLEELQVFAYIDGQSLTPKSFTSGDPAGEKVPLKEMGGMRGVHKQF